MVVLVDLGHGEGHAGQAAVVDEQVEGLRGQQGHPVPASRAALTQSSVLQIRLGQIPANWVVMETRKATVSPSDEEAAFRATLNASETDFTSMQPEHSSKRLGNFIQPQM